MLKQILIWILTALGLKSWLIGYEAKVAADKQEADTREDAIAQEVEDEKQNVADTPDSELDDLLDRLQHDAQARRDSVDADVEGDS